MVLGGAGGGGVGWWVTVLVSSQDDIKWTMSASNDHFCAKGLGRISRKTSFQPDRIIKIEVKSIRTTGQQLPLFMRSLGDAQCETRELP